jgi:hypothetical protein
MMLIMLLSFMVFSATKTVIVKTVIKADTIIKIDTVYFVKYDTTKYTEIVKDTMIASKLDSVKTSSKPVPLQPVAPVKKVK